MFNDKNNFDDVEAMDKKYIPMLEILLKSNIDNKNINFLNLLNINKKYNNMDQKLKKKIDERYKNKIMTILQNTNDILQLSCI